ncbi:MAG: transglutaminase domain-containing protein [Candidatus Xenobia bacterium]
MSEVLRRRLFIMLGVLIWTITAAIAASQLSVPLGVLGAVAGTVAGCWIGYRLAESKLRFPAIWGGAVAVWVLVGVMDWMVRELDLFSMMVGPTLAYTLAEGLEWFLLLVAIVGVLRASSLRFPPFLALEMAVVGTVFAGIFAAHREGFINRPYFLVDPIWARGWDPLPIFLALGAGVAALLIIMAASQRSERRSFVDLVVLLLMVAAIFYFFPVEKIKDIPQIRQTYGKHGDKDASPSPTPDASGKGGGSGTPSPTPGDGKGDKDPTDPTWQQGMKFNNASANSANPPVAVVLLHSDHDPASGYYYFRSTAFSQYNGQRLVRDESGVADRDLIDTFPSGSVAVAAPQAAASTFQTLDTTVALLTDHTRPFGLINPTMFREANNPDPKRFQRAYDVTSQALTRGLVQLLGYPSGDPSWSPELLKHYTEAPTDPRYKQLADQIMQGVRSDLQSDPMARAAAVKVWLEKNGTYSLTSSHAEDSPDPVGDFLFGDRTGYCVHFAHAAVYLFRTLGIPSRVGAGYAVNARNRQGGSSLLVRERDSHAWPEIYLQDVGWVVVDIIPEKSLVPPEDPPDPGMQQMMGDMARQQNKKDEQAPQHKDVQKMVQQTLTSALRYLWPMLLAALIALYGVKLWRRSVPFFCAPRHLPRLTYRAALDEMAEAGRVRRFGQTREDFARQQSGVPAFQQLTERHHHAMLGRNLPAPARRDYINLYLEAGEQVRHEAGLLQKLLGLLNPFSWWRVR